MQIFAADPIEIWANGPPHAVVIQRSVLRSVARLFVNTSCISDTIADLGSSTVADSISLEVLDQLQNTSEPCALSEAGGQEISAANNIYPDLSSIKM